VALWLWLSFPKSLSISKSIDKAAGAEREVVGQSPNWRPAKTHGGAGFDKLGEGEATMNLTAPATDLAQAWDGYGTALKPAVENVILARKPSPNLTGFDLCATILAEHINQLRRAAQWSSESVNGAGESLKPRKPMSSEVEENIVASDALGCHNEEANGESVPPAGSGSMPSEAESSGERQRIAATNVETLHVGEVVRIIQTGRVGALRDLMDTLPS